MRTSGRVHGCWRPGVRHRRQRDPDRRSRGTRGNVACRRCYYCANDFPYYFCQDLEDYGNSLNLSRPPGLFGGWSQYMYSCREHSCSGFPDGLPDEVAVLTEVMAVTHGIDTALTAHRVAGRGSIGFLGRGAGCRPAGAVPPRQEPDARRWVRRRTDVLAGRLERAAAFGVGPSAGCCVDDRRRADRRILAATMGVGSTWRSTASGVPATFTRPSESCASAA